MNHKNKEMLKIFWEAFNGNETTIALITPKEYKKTIDEINYQKLKKCGIKNIIFDIDNTIMPVNEIKVTKNLKEHINNLKKDFNVFLLSNNDEKRVNPVAENLQIESIPNAKKPTQIAYNKLKEKIKITNGNTAIIGDQILTDTVFGNKYNLYTILVEPFKKKYDIKTGINRILQNILMKKIKKIKRYHYY